MAKRPSVDVPARMNVPFGPTAARPHRYRAFEVATVLAGCARLAIAGLIGLIALAFDANAQTLPTGGVVSAGNASISSTSNTLTVNQSSQNAAINWQSFGIGKSDAVQFVQPNADSVTLNRVLGPDPSNILGSLSANGKVFLVNPNGVLFGKGAQVNVGGLVASTLGLTDANFMKGQYGFSGTGGGAVDNRGSINADGGYVVLLGANVNNEGVISARLGTVALAAGSAVTLDVAGDGLLNVAVNEGAVNALVQNAGMIRANGGQVLMTAQAAGALLRTAVNNTGVIEAQTIENHNGTIKLLGDMQSGTANVGGTLDASAPNGGDGGSIETSAAHVKIADKAVVTTQSAQGRLGSWLIDPNDFTIGAGGDISGPTLSGDLVSSNVTISSNDGATGTNGDVNVNAALTWTAATTLTLNAVGNVNFNAAVTTTGGNLVANAGNDINVAAAMTITGGNAVLRADSDGTGPGGGTVVFAPATPTFTATGTNTTITIYYGPSDYAAPTDFSSHFTLTEGATLKPYMWLYLQGVDKTYDATAAAALSFVGTPTAGGDDVTLVAGTANFDNKNVGTGKPVAYSGFGIGGADAGKFQLFALLGDAFGTGTTTADITALALMGSITAADKVYDATTSATILTRSLSGVLGGDDVSYSGGSALFSDKNVGVAKTVTGTGLSLSGADAGNYTVNTTAATTADITALALTGNITAADKVYDATTSATILTRTLSGVLGGDDVSYAGGTATFSDKNVGVAKTVTGSGLSLSGADAGNYTVNTSAATTADITALALTGSITAADKVYDATTSAKIGRASCRERVLMPV